MRDSTKQLDNAEQAGLEPKIRVRVKCGKTCSRRLDPLKIRHLVDEVMEVLEEDDFSKAV